MRSILIKVCILLLLCISVVFIGDKQEIKEEKKPMLVQVQSEKDEIEVEIEAYVMGVVASEMPYSFSLEALKAQSVAARTFVMQRGLKVDDTTSTQVYRSESELKEIHDENYEEMYSKVKQAVVETKGEVLLYEGNYISALFFSCSNGATNKASWYYTNDLPYLQSVPSLWDQKTKAYVQSKEILEKEVLQKLEIHNFYVGEITYYDSGYIKDINIGGKKFSGREVREKLALRSSCFSFAKVEDSIVVHTKGYGHGVGMSQYGANEMAKEGYTYKEILAHYYRGTTLSSL